MKKYFLIFFLLLFSWSTFKSYRYTSSLSKEIIASEKVLELSSKIEKIKAILTMEDKDKITITNYESIAALKEISTMSSTINSISNSYSHFHKTHINGSQEGFLYNLFIGILLFFASSVMLVLDYNQRTLISKNDLPHFLKNIFFKIEKVNLSLKNFRHKSDSKILISKVKKIDNINLKPHIFKSDDNHSTIQKEDKNSRFIDNNKISNFISSSLVSGPMKDYIVEEVEPGNDFQFKFIIKSLNNQKLEINYDLIPTFIKNIKNTSSHINPTIKLTRDIFSKQLDFSILFDTLVSTNGENLNVQSN